MSRRLRRVFLLVASIAILAVCQLVIPASERQPDSTPIAVYEPLNESSSMVLRRGIRELPADDLSRLMDLRDFEFRINNFPCNKSTNRPFLIILVHSAPDHVLIRRTIRNTWGRNRDDSFSLLFLLGLVDSMEAQREIDKENDLHSDIIQGSFDDAYRNMTYKHAMALKWALYYCPRAKYILKTDDDVFVNTPFLVKYLRRDISPYGAKKLMLCSICAYCYVKRTHRSKWRVSPMEYTGRVYPPFCFGFAILYSPDVALELYEEAQRSDYFWIDDVFITGVLAMRRNISQSSIEALLLDKNRMEGIIEKGSVAPDSFLFGPSDLSLEVINRLWSAVERGGNATTMV